MPRSRLSRESEPSPQPLFDAVHLAAIGFVIVAEQMQHAVEYQRFVVRREAVRPYSLALRRAVAGEMAMSPRNLSSAIAVCGATSQAAPTGTTGFAAM